MKRLDALQTPAWESRPYVFDRVEVTGIRMPSNGRIEVVSFSLLGRCYSEYRSGPGLCMLADAVSDIVGTGCYGLNGCRLLGCGREAERIP